MQLYSHGPQHTAKDPQALWCYGRFSLISSSRCYCMLFTFSHRGVDVNNQELDAEHNLPQNDNLVGSEDTGAIISD